MLALSVIVNVPFLVPAAVGVNVTLIVQLDPAARLEPQLFAWPKSPVMAKLEILNAALPEFESVTL